MGIAKYVGMCCRADLQICGLTQQRNFTRQRKGLPLDGAGGG